MLTISLPSFLSDLIMLLVNLVRNASNLLRTSASPYHLSTSCSPPPPPGAPCTCGYPTGMSSTYIVSGFSAASACPTCDLSSDPVWTGTMYHATAGCVWWAVTPAFDPLSINGVILEASYTQLRLNGSASPCRWELVISCGSATFPSKVMWLGYKTTGSTPVGTYTFASADCGSGPATLSVA